MAYKYIKIFVTLIMTYECNKCMKTFHKKSSYDCHMSRKFSCIKENEDEIKCIYCNKLYSTKYNLKIHIIHRLQDILAERFLILCT